MNEQKWLKLLLFLILILLICTEKTYSNLNRLYIQVYTTAEFSAFNRDLYREHSHTYTSRFITFNNDRFEKLYSFNHDRFEKLAMEIKVQLTNIEYLILLLSFNLGVLLKRIYIT